MGRIYSFQPQGMDKVIDENHRITACAADKSSYIHGGDIKEQMDINQVSVPQEFTPSMSQGFDM